MELQRDVLSLSGSMLLVDVGPTSSFPAQNQLSADIACKYVNLKLVKGECRGMRIAYTYCFRNLFHSLISTL